MACLEETAVGDFLKGKLSAEMEQTFELHLERCDSCRGLLVAMARSSVAGRADAPSDGRDPAQVPLAIGGRLGRYIVLGCVGGASTGIVYSAYDPDNDRKVALKLFRANGPSPSKGGAEGGVVPHVGRHLREAKAVAKVVHPNVAAVHEVGVLDGRVFMATDFVRGITLRDWQSKSARSWREILDTYVAAGRGLAAAHAAQVLHRDFKPESVLVGEDGVPRVIDFSLTGRDPEFARPADARSAYAAPEARAGEATAKSDQFGFCVALYEALYGLYPFAIGQPSGQIRQPPKTRDVPARVLACLSRGLRLSPDARYPSMDALLDAIGRPPERKWLRYAAWAAVPIVLAGGLLLTRALLHRVDGGSCGTGAIELAGTWDAPRKNAIREAFLGTGLPYAVQTHREAERTLESFADAWIDAHWEVCQRAKRHPEATESIAARAQCLDASLDEFRIVSEAFAKADGVVVEHAVAAAQELSHRTVPATCIEARTPPLAPGDSERTRVDNMKSQLFAVRALAATGRNDAALRNTLALEPEARATGWLPLEAEVLLAKGAIEADIAHARSAKDALLKAIHAAERAGDDGTRARASIALVDALGIDPGDYDEAKNAEGSAQALVERLGRDEGNLAWLAEVASRSLLRHGDLVLARTRADTALELRTKVFGPNDPRVADALVQLAHVEWRAGQLEEASSALERAQSIFEKVLGLEHPKVASTLAVRASVLGDRRRFSEAVTLAERAIDVAEKGSRPPSPWQLAEVERIAGKVLDDAGHHDSAAAHLEKAIGHTEAVLGADHATTAMAHAMFARNLRFRGRFEEAIAHDTRALAAWQPKNAPGHPDRVLALLGLGQSYLALASPQRAVEPLERALALEASPGQGEVERAAVQFALARALWEGKKDRPRARKLAAQAKEIFSRNAHHERDVSEVAAWLDKPT